MLPKSNTAPSNKLLGYNCQTSLYGRVIPVIYGRCRVSTNVIWTGGWTANPVSGGKGNKGKGSNQQYDYITNLLMSIGEGPILGVYSIWRDKDLFNLAYYTDVYTIPGGGGTFRSTIGGTGNPYWWVLNVSVARDDGLVTITPTDYGSPGATTITATQYTPMVLVPSAPGAGQYTLSGVGGPAGDGYGHYGFSAADAGKSVYITYAYQINNYSTVGSPMTHLNFELYMGTVGQAACNWMTTNAAFASQALGYSETAYIASGAFDLGSAGVIPNLNFEVQGRCGFLGYTSAIGTGMDSAGYAIVDCNPADMINDILTNPLTGVLGWSTPAGGTGYGPVTITGLCTITGVGSATIGTGLTITTGSLATVSLGQQIIIGGVSTTLAVIATNTTGTTSDPLDVGTSIPWSATVWQTYTSVSGSSQWLPASTAANGIGSGGQTYVYCAANGLFMSRCYDDASSAREIINHLLELGNSDAFWSEGMLKFGCYGDTSALGNGFHYSPSTAPIYDVNDASLICAPGGEPITHKAPDIRDVKNEVSVSWTNRSAQYATNTLPPAQDSSMVSKYGRLPAGNKDCKEIAAQPVAVMVQNTSLKRAVYIDGSGTWELTLPPHYALLDPMDLITVTESYTGLSHTPLRILRIEEDDKLCLKLTLEAFPWSTSAPTLYQSQGQSPTSASYNIAPGHVNTPMFVALPEGIVNGNQYSVGIALGGGQNWGGAVVYVSTDGGNSYNPIGKCTGAATNGSLTAALPSNPDPDTTDTLAVDLTISSGDLDSFTQAQADSDVSLIAVDSELLSYETATNTGTNQYSLTYLRRGVYGTTNTAHAIGAPFSLVDSLFQYDYPASSIGTTIYFKFCSVNLAGGAQEDVTQVTAYPWFVPTPRMPYPWNAGFETPVSGDPLFAQSNFGLSQSYQVAQNGTPQPQLTIFGTPPSNVFSTLTGVPSITSVTVNAGAGSLAAGTYILTAMCYDGVTPATAGHSDLSAQLAVVVPSSGSALSVTINWPSGSYGGALYAAITNTNKGMNFQVNVGSGAATSGSVAYTNCITSFNPSTIGPPDDQYSSLLFKVSREFVSGPWCQTAATITTGVLHLGAGGGTANDSVGRIISKVANAIANIGTRLPIQDFIITANDTSGNYTLTPDPLAAGCAAGDQFTMRTGGPGAPGTSTTNLTVGTGSQTITTQSGLNYLAGGYVSLYSTGSGATMTGSVTSYSGTSLVVNITAVTGSGSHTDWNVAVVNTPLVATATSYYDPLYANYYNGAGITAHGNGGNLAFVLGGNGSGQAPVTVQDNGLGVASGSAVKVSQWQTTPNATSVIVLVENTPQVVSPANPQQYSVAPATASAQIAGLVPVPNYAGMVVRIEAYTVDSEGSYGSQQYVAFREQFIWGAQGTAVV